MNRLLKVFMVILVGLAVACGADSFDSSLEDEASFTTADGGQSNESGNFGAVQATPAPAATTAPFAAQSPSVERGLVSGAGESFVGGDASAQASAFQNAGRKVISTASVSLEVTAVSESVAEIRSIAEGLGGFVEQLNSSGDAERERASMTIRVPQDQFFAALERIEGLGEVSSRNMGTEDVSSQFIDLEARLKSSLREEQSLLALLERADTVSEILTIERELNRVRTEIERVQGQLNFLERRVELATILVSLSLPVPEFSQPPTGALTVDVSDVIGRVNDVRNRVAGLGGEVDRLSLSERDGVERAEMTFRVFAADFQQTIAFLEEQGKVRSKDIQERGGVAAGDTKQGDEPGARVELAFRQEIDETNVGLIVAIAAPIGGVIFAGLIGWAFYMAYRSGRRQGGSA